MQLQDAEVLVTFNKIGGTWAISEPVSEPVAVVSSTEAIIIKVAAGGEGVAAAVAASN